jgi:cobalt-zinc-cadmium resistance protein CzcA
MVPFLDRSDLVHLTTHTVLHNLTEGIVLVSVILLIFLGNIRGALIVTLTIPFALLFASICLQSSGIPANLLSLGALDFGMIVEGAVVMIENIVRLLSHGDRIRRSRQRKDPAGGARSPAPRVLFHRHHHHRVSADFHLAGSGRALVQADGLDGGIRAAGRPHFLDADRPGARLRGVSQGHQEWRNPGMVWLTRMYDTFGDRHPQALGTVGAGGRDSCRNQWC